ncbi:family 78 glycoside hydrolase catalytic domain [Winogradskyella flava]|uniref:alpha-L-rhamnosidase n=1 Tax=Winogradskyella flava TaxID=1884876 RepID=A0A842IN73_9FLAO|nr:family 78 glycoside hydrolase catalytic domain [Winogradskyella flava]MBC2844692.1 family 78 glycoside hydrolase catalytic domain [Winogradskyella flava]
MKQSKKSKLPLLFWCCFVSFFVCVSCNQEEIKRPESLVLSENFVNPIGFYNAKPTFSWQLPVSEDIKSQSAYQIVLASSSDLLPNNPDLWDSKKQKSSQSTFVKYQGSELQSRQKVFWQVKYWNQDEEVSDWSDINTFELGLLHNADWKAKWAGLDTAKDSIKGVRKFLMHRPQYLRKGFELSSDVASARLYITAKGVFDVHLNGKNVSDDVMPPGWTPYNHRIETLTYDVTELLQAGKNALAVELASGWHSGRISRGKALYENFASPKILCQLEVTMKDGSKQTIISDESCKGTTNGPIRLASIYDGEVYDSNLEIPNWRNAEFDDASWEAVETESISSSVKLEPKRHHAVKNKTTIDDVEIISVHDNSAVFNLKQNMVGVPRVKVPMKKGDTLKIRFSEMLLADKTFYTKNYRSAHSTDYYIASKDGVIEYTPKFTFHGFQYVELSGYDEKVKPESNWVQGLVQHSDFEAKGTFTSSHDKLNQLQDNNTWGLRGNFFDIPTDCPQRDERLGWTGDAQVIAPTALFNYNTHAFWTAWLQSLRENQSEHKDGMVPFIVPDVLQTKNGSSGWGDAAVIIPWDIYNATGDITVLEESYESAKKWVGYYQSKVKKKPYIPIMHSFGDWLQPYPSETLKKANRGDTPKELINTAYFAHSAHLISKIAGVIGKTEDEKKYVDLYKAVANAFENEFFDENGKFKQDRQTQTSYLLGIYFDLFKPETKLKAQNHLLEEIKNADYHLGTGFLGTPVLPKVLDDMGEIDLMYKILFKESYPSWFYSINQGATTMWERWNSYSKADGYNPQPMNSLNHYAYGAIGQWLYERMAGLASLKPGYKKIRIAPLPNTEFLTSASASVKTPYGKAASSWKIENSTFNLDVVIPPNTTAEIQIPYGIQDNLIINGGAFKETSNLKLISSDSDSIEILAAPGTYNFQTKL